jgi:hypothetical protein
MKGVNTVQREARTPSRDLCFASLARLLGGLLPIDKLCRILLLVDSMVFFGERRVSLHDKVEKITFWSIYCS